eukprot:5298639-Pyramimonas_sp.AAC.2
MRTKARYWNRFANRILGAPRLTQFPGHPGNCDSPGHLPFTIGSAATGEGGGGQRGNVHDRKGWPEYSAQRWDHCGDASR